MFQLHDKTRRRICLGGFLALAVVPTVLVAIWCVARNLPGHTSAEARRLSRQLGLEVSFDHLRHLRPGVVLYEGFELADPETGSTILRCRLLEVARKECRNQRGESRNALVLVASQPEIEGDHLGELGRLLRSAMQLRTGRPDLDLRLSAGETTLRAGENSQTLTDLCGRIEHLASGTEAQVTFRLAGVETPRPVQIRLVRNRQIKPPGSGFELDTGGGALPCSVLGMGIPELKLLGRGCRFRGRFWGNQGAGSTSAEDWDGDATGQLLGVDLDCLVSDNFPHKLSGTADVTIQRARFHRGRLEEGSGIVAAGPGVISRSLIDAAAERLGLIRNVQLNAYDEMIPYERLALACVIGPEGLALFGACAAAPGAILIDRRHCLLSEPAAEPQPVAALLRTLVPQSELQVPATRQTDWLMRRLPVPEVVHPAAVPSVSPHARLRLGRQRP